MLKEAFLGRQPSHFHVNPFVKAFIIADSLLWAGWNFVVPIFAIFIANDIAGGSIEIAASAFSAHLIGRIIFELISGRALGSANERKKIGAIILGFIITGLAFFSFAFIDSVFLVYVLYALSGIGLGIASPAKNSLFATHLDKNKEATEWGVYDATVFVGMALSAALGGFIAGKYGFDILFIASGILMWIGIIPYILFLADGKDPHLRNQKKA